MSDIIPFSFEGSQVRTLDLDGETWFVARDVVEAVGAVWNGNQAIKHIPEQWKGVRPDLTPGGNQQVSILSEQGVYFYLSRSDKPKALPIQMWLAGEVMPSIRKTGGYGMLDPIKVLNDPAAMRGLLLTYAEKAIALQETIDEMKPAVAALDRISASDGSLCITDAAKTLQVKPKALFAWLRQSNWVYTRPGSAKEVAYQGKISCGWLEHKVHTVVNDDGSEKTHTQVRVTPKGLAEIGKRLLDKSPDLFTHFK